MYSSLLVGLALVVGAPGAKEEPKKEAASIVGEWVGEKAVRGGKETPVPEGGITFTFTTEGKMMVSQGGKASQEAIAYKVDLKKKPAEISMEAPGDKGTIKGIFKIEGDTLTLCIAQGKDGEQPTKFESGEGSKTMLMTLKRKKK